MKLQRDKLTGFISRNKKWILPCILVFAALLYVGNINDALISDDWHLLWIAAHPTQSLASYFLTNYEGGTLGSSYRPLVNIFWALGYAIGGVRPWVFHLMSLAFHLGTVAFVFRLARQISLFKKSLLFATLAALFFAVFPNHAEPVIWVGSAVDPIATFFVLLSLSLYLDFRKREQHKWLFFAGSLLAFAFGLLEKEIAIVLPVVIATWELFHFTRSKWTKQFRKSVTYLLPYIALFGIYAFLRYRATGVFFGYYGAPELSIDPLVATRTYLAIPISHFVSGVLRTNTMDFLYTVIDRRVEVALLASGLLGLFALLRPRRIVWWLFVSFVVSIAPVMQFGINHLPGRFSDEGERYAYLPSVFFALLLAWGVVSLSERLPKQWRPAPLIGAFIIIVLMAVQLWTKTQIWHTGSQIAERTMDSWIEMQDESEATVIRTIGIPDNYRGVPIWRNGFVQALSFQGIDIEDHKIDSIRTVIDDVHAFNVSRENSTFVYQSESQTSDIVGPATLKDENGLISELGERTFVIYALTYRDFSHSAQTRLSEIGRKMYGDRDIVLRFWNGDGWIQETLH